MHSNKGKHGHVTFKDHLSKEVALSVLEPATPSPANAAKSASIYSESADSTTSSNDRNLSGFVVSDNDIPPRIFPSNASTGPRTPNNLTLAQNQQRRVRVSAPDPPQLQPPSIVHFGPLYTICNLNCYKIAFNFTNIPKRRFACGQCADRPVNSFPYGQNDIYVQK